MRHPVRRLLAVAIALTLAATALATVAFTASAAQPPAGFTALFNGKDLTGWKTTGNWVVDTDGSITLHPREGEKGWQRYDAAVAAAAPEFPAADTVPEDDALCYFTSGTTGYPKMAIQTQGYGLAHQITGRYWLDLKPGDLIETFDERQIVRE